MDSLGALVRSFFDSEGWPVDEVEPEELFETSFEGEQGAWLCHVHVYDTDQRVVMVSTHRELAEPELRAAVAEFCNRANFGLAVGNFELDHDSGEVRFRTGVDLLDVPPTVGAVRNVVVANVLTMDQYLPALVAVLAGATPADAVAEVEEAEVEETDDRDDLGDGRV